MKYSWALPLGISAALAVAGILWNGGIIYGLDDAYIHMAVGKNCALHGGWGINPGELQTATSSLAYPAMLCGFYRIFGVSEALPLLINLGALLGILAYAKKRFNLDAPKLLAFYFITFLPFLVASGMEHSLHILLAVVFIGEITRDKRGLLFAISAIALPALRYESLALLFAGFVYLALKKDRDSLLVAGSGILAVASMAVLYFMTGYPLPISMIVKSPYQIRSVLSIFKLVFRFPYNLMISSWFFSEYILSLINFTYTKDGESKAMAGIFLIAAALHSQFGAMDFRYFAYLQAAFFLQFSNLKTRDIIKGIKPVTAFFMIPLFLVASLNAFQAATAPHDIFIQQYQVASFLKGNYMGQVVMLNDVGTTSFYSGARVVDLVGLANREVLEARVGGTFDSEFIDGLAAKEDVAVALVYDEWFPGQIPSSFEKVGELVFHFKVISGKGTISAYAVGENAGRLRENLAAYAWPDEVSLELTGT